MNTQGVPIVRDEIADRVFGEFLRTPAAAIASARETALLVDAAFYEEICLPLQRIDGLHKTSVAELARERGTSFDAAGAARVHETGAAVGALYIHHCLVQEWLAQRDAYDTIMTLPEYATFRNVASERIDEGNINRDLLPRRNPALWYRVWTLAEYYGVPAIAEAARTAYGLLSLCRDEGVRGLEEIGN